MLHVRTITLTLLAGEETVAQIPFLYGEDLSRVQLPPVPELEGNYGAAAVVLLLLLSLADRRRKKKKAAKTAEARKEQETAVKS